MQMIRSVTCRFHVMSIRYVGEYGSRSNKTDHFNKNLQKKICTSVLHETVKTLETLCA